MKAQHSKSSKDHDSKKSNDHSSKTTTDHDEIRKWVEERGGTPSKVDGTGDEGSGVLRIDFPGYSGSGRLVPIEWDEWFEIFDESGLAFLYQEETAAGKESRFSKLIQREE